jgi:hypothetical protein
MPFDTRFWIFFIRLPILDSAAKRLLTPVFLAGPLVAVQCFDSPRTRRVLAFAFLKKPLLIAVP